MATRRPQMAADGPPSPSPNRLPRIPTPLLLMLGVAAIVGVGVLIEDNRALRSELAELRIQEESLRDRERRLVASMARQSQTLRDHEDEAEALRYRLETVELQLDGVEHIGRELRSELGLVNAPASGAPQGGPFGDETSLGERAEIARRRLAVGLSELVGLRELLRQRRLAEAARDADGAGTPTDGAAGSEPSVAQSAFDTIPEGWPVSGTPTITSDYGWRVFRGRPNFHTGLDIGLPTGSDVLATADGTVVGAGWQPGYGHSVLLQHGEGYNSLYAHLSGPLVRVGDIVRRGDKIGLSGSSGNSTGPHLHYEIWRDGVLVDPSSPDEASH